MQKVYEEIKRRNIFQVSTEELENGERPGWVHRSIYFVRGERTLLTFDVQQHISTWQAYVGIIRINAGSKIAKYVPQAQKVVRAPKVLREKYEDTTLQKRVRYSEEED